MKGWGMYELMRRRAAGETVEEIAGHAPTTPEAERTPSMLDIYLAERKKYDGDRFLAKLQKGRLVFPCDGRRLHQQ
jgi:hypothetical protein